MNPDHEPLHVSPLADGNWAVEKDSGASVAQETIKERAVEIAQKVGGENGASEVVVHTADGSIETTLPTTPAAQQEDL